MLQNGLLVAPKTKYSIQTEKWVARHENKPFWQWFYGSLFLGSYGIYGVYTPKMLILLKTSPKNRLARRCFLLLFLGSYGSLFLGSHGIYGVYTPKMVILLETSSKNGLARKCFCAFSWGPMGSMAFIWLLAQNHCQNGAKVWRANHFSVWIE